MFCYSKRITVKVPEHEEPETEWHTNGIFVQWLV